MGIGSHQILLILLVVALLFGATKLPQIGKGMGEAIRNFKKSVKDVDDATDITPNLESKRDEQLKQSVAEEKKETKA